MLTQRAWWPNASLYELLIYLIVNIAFIELLSYGFVNPSHRKWEGWISRKTLILISAEILLCSLQTGSLDAGNFGYISLAGRGAESHEGIEVYRGAEGVRFEAG